MTRICLECEKELTEGELTVIEKFQILRIEKHFCSYECFKKHDAAEIQKRTGVTI